MSSHKNHRRGHGRIQGNGPRWENKNPEAGCNSTHVARARSAWKRLDARKERRTGKSAAHPLRGRPVELPSDEVADWEDTCD